MLEDLEGAEGKESEVCAEVYLERAEINEQGGGHLF